jgi:hypothetical protein
LYRNLFLAPSLSVLPSSPELSTLQAVLHVASGAPVDSAQSGTMVSFSGSTVHHGVLAALGTVTAESQLGINYIARVPPKARSTVDVKEGSGGGFEDGGDGLVEVSFTATGTLWRRELEDVVRSFDAVWELVLEAALGPPDESGEDEPTLSSSSSPLPPLPPPPPPQGAAAVTEWMAVL